MLPSSKPQPNNGVTIKPQKPANAEYRTYEIYQRERPGESTEKIAPGQLTHSTQLTDPHGVHSILRENYPCYRDWAGNAYWLTQYNDVTSVFTDRANVAVATRAQDCGLKTAEDFSGSPAAQGVWANLLDNELPRLCEELLDDLPKLDHPDLSIDYAQTLANQLQFLALGISQSDYNAFVTHMWHLQRADSWQPALAQKGQESALQLVQLINNAKNPQPDNSLKNALPDASSADLLATVLGFEARTLHGWIANLFHALLSDPAAMELATQGRAELKIATLETMRYSPVVPYAHCYTKHEVERFGRLLPQGALLRLSAEAANRDPRVFSQPEQFIPDRTDICHREARGQYRADGLATGIAFGLGLPSRHPAVPETRPRSLYALTRDATVLATERLLKRYPGIIATQPMDPIRALAIFEPMIAWSLPVRLTPIDN